MKKIFLIILLLGLYTHIFPSNSPAAAAAGAGANIDSAQKKQTAEKNAKNNLTGLPKKLENVALNYLHAFEPISEIPLQAAVEKLIVSADNNYIAITLRADGNFGIYDRKGEYKTLIYKKNGIVFNLINTIITNLLPLSIAFSPDGKYLAIGTMKNPIALYELFDGSYALRQRINQPDSSITLSFWKRDNNLFLGCGTKYEALVFRLQNNNFTLIKTFSIPELGRSDNFFAITKFSADGSTIVIENNGLLYIAKLQQDQKYTITPIKISDRPQCSLTLSSNGKYLAIEPCSWTDEPMNRPFKIDIWQLDNKIQHLQELTFNQMPLIKQFSPDGSYLYVSLHDTIQFFKKNDQNIYELIYEIKDKSILLPTIKAFTPDIFHAIGVLNFQDRKVSLFKLEQLATIVSLRE
jgi:WD40 repeat protein